MALPIPQLPPVMTTLSGWAGMRQTWRTAAWCAAAARPPRAPPARTGSQAGATPDTPAGEGEGRGGMSVSLVGSGGGKALLAIVGMAACRQTTADGRHMRQ